jgi:choline dehydrogenase-like flavoprotein
MAETLPKVDVVFVGVGFTAAIVARELKDASIRMVGLERGRRRDTVSAGTADYGRGCVNVTRVVGRKAGIMSIRPPTSLAASMVALLLRLTPMCRY